MGKRKPKFEMPDGHEQMPILTEPAEIKEIEEEHEVTDEVLEDTPIIVSDSKRGSGHADFKVKVKSYCLVKGSIETKDLRLKVISVYDLSGVENIPDAEMLGVEVNSFVGNSLGAIEKNAGMIAKSLTVLTRGGDE